MLAVATTHNLVTLDQATLKRPPASVPPTCSLPLPPTSVVWSPDGASLFLSNASEIHTYDSSGIFQSTSYSSAEGPLSNLASKDRGSTVIFSRAQQVHVLQPLTGTVAQTFDSHNAPITSLALSNDGTLLATTSANAIHVHNLSHGAHTVLRGLPAASHTITSCTFHAHSRTRLLVGAGAQLLVYDTTRPSAPLKAIPLSKDKSGFGDIVSVASSPFSKTLVAVASSGGIVSLVDLEKEKRYDSELKHSVMSDTFSQLVPYHLVSCAADDARFLTGRGDPIRWNREWENPCAGSALARQTAQVYHRQRRRRSSRFYEHSSRADFSTPPPPLILILIRRNHSRKMSHRRPFQRFPASPSHSRT